MTLAALGSGPKMKGRFNWSEMKLDDNGAFVVKSPALPRTRSVYQSKCYLLFPVWPSRRRRRCCCPSRLHGIGRADVGINPPTPTTYVPSQQQHVSLTHLFPRLTLPEPDACRVDRENNRLREPVN